MERNERPIDVKIYKNHFVTVLPPGSAQNANHLRNRGRDDILVEITAWPTQDHHGKMTTGAPWRSIDDYGNTELTLIHQINPDDEAARIRLQWLGRQRWASYAADEHAHRIMRWFAFPDESVRNYIRGLSKMHEPIPRKEEK